MKQITFQCTFLSDVVLNAQSSTEGMPKTLDYIPGSNFLGIVARNYTSYKELKDDYTVFHSGKVRFGDAHLLLDGKRTLKAPLSWFINKGTSVEDGVYLHHSIAELSDPTVQLKQVRSGWFTADGKIGNPGESFSIKSAYDRETRTSKEGQMFGYKALTTGLEWEFTIEIDDDIDKDKTLHDMILNDLEGERNIGRSRSAQYGRVLIKKKEELSPTTEEKKIEATQLIIYAESRLAFYDEYGQPTLQPKPGDFGLGKDWKIQWAKCQIKPQVYAPYRGINKAREPDRVCFEKGSVFVFQSNSKIDLNKMNNTGVGTYLNEGFGKVLVNPDFLKAGDAARLKMALEFTSDGSTSLPAIKPNDSSDRVLIEWIKKIKNDEVIERDIHEKVRAFVKNKGNRFKKITPSQWGQIRALAVSAENYTQFYDWLFTPIETNDVNGNILAADRARAGFLLHGKSAKKWEKCAENLKTELDMYPDSENRLTYALRLVTQMQKEAKKNIQAGGNNNG